MTIQQLRIKSKTISADMEAKEKLIADAYANIFEYESDLQHMQDALDDVDHIIANFEEPKVKPNEVGKHLLAHLKDLGAAVKSPFTPRSNQEFQYSVTYYEGVPYWIEVSHVSKNRRRDPKHIITTYASFYNQDDTNLPLDTAPVRGVTFADLAPNDNVGLSIKNPSTPHTKKAVTVVYNAIGQAHYVWWRAAALQNEDILKIGFRGDFGEKLSTQIRNPLN
jgi:hypothetical protein